MAEIIVRRIGILCWHPLINQLIEIAQKVHIEGEKYDDVVNRLEKATDDKEKKKIIQEINTISSVFEKS